jgi:hypothetical protein
MNYRSLLIDNHLEDANADQTQKPILLNVLVQQVDSDDAMGALSVPLSVHDIYSVENEVQDLVNSLINSTKARRRQNLLYESVDSMGAVNELLTQYLNSFSIGHRLANNFKDYPREDCYLEIMDSLDELLTIDLSNHLPIKKKSKAIKSVQVLLTFLPFDLKSKHDVKGLVEALIGFVVKDFKIKQTKKIDSLVNHVNKHLPITLRDFETIENLDRTYVEISKLAELINSI